MTSYILDISQIFLYMLVLYRKAVVSRCGNNISAMGPFNLGVYVTQGFLLPLG